MKKKILFVINSLDCGGAEKSLVSLLSSFDYSKYDVYLQMFNNKGMFIDLLPKEVIILPELDYIVYCRNNLFKQLSNLKFAFTRLKTFFGLKFNKNLHNAQKYWKYTQNAFPTLRDTYDVAIAWGQGTPTHYVSKKVNANKKIAVININYELAGHNKNFDYEYYKNYQYIATVSDELKKITLSVFPEFADKIVTLYDINNAELITKMAELNNPFKDIENKTVIVTVGRLTQQKGYDLLAGACKILKEQGLNFVWYVLGEGPERMNIENDILNFGLKDYLILQGAEKNPYSYIKNADIYVQTSKFEGYCLTLCEARILNKPIVSTDFDVVHNQLTDGENGLIVDMNSNSIAQGILRLINDNDLTLKLVNNLKKEKKGNIEEIYKLYDFFEM